MNVVEVILLIGGIGVFIASFFVGNRKEDEKKSEAVVTELSDSDREKIEAEVAKQIEDVIRDKMEDVTEQTEAKMDKISNTKILELNDYAETIMNEINKNHNETVFLYDMLNEKAKEVRNTVKDVNIAKKEVDRITSQQSGAAQSAGTVKTATGVDSTDSHAAASENVADSSDAKNSGKQPVKEKADVRGKNAQGLNHQIDTSLYTNINKVSDGNNQYGYKTPTGSKDLAKERLMELVRNSSRPDYRPENYSELEPNRKAAEKQEKKVEAVPETAVDKYSVSRKNEAKVAEAKAAEVKAASKPAETKPAEKTSAKASASKPAEKKAAETKSFDDVMAGVKSSQAAAMKAEQEVSDIVAAQSTPKPAEPVEAKAAAKADVEPAEKATEKAVEAKAAAKADAKPAEKAAEKPAENKVSESAAADAVAADKAVEPKAADKPVEPKAAAKADVELAKEVAEPVKKAADKPVEPKAADKPVENKPAKNSGKDKILDDVKSEAKLSSKKVKKTEELTDVDDEELKPAPKRTVSRRVVSRKVSSSQASELVKLTAPKAEDIVAGFDDDMTNSDKIMELSRHGISNKEIAKVLNIGLGEVRLVVDLLNSSD